MSTPGKFHKVAAHPAAYPVELPNALMRYMTTEGEAVFDPFVGAGTTVVGCEQSGRVGYGSDLSPKYVAVTLERLSGMGLTPEQVE